MTTPPPADPVRPADANGEPTLLVEPEPNSGAENMRVDAALLNAAALTDDDAQPTVRIYQWEEPTLSLGHFQKEPLAVPERFAKLPRVHRLSGGGAILHDQELTYSVTLPKRHPLAQTPRDLYGVVHGSIIGLLAELGIEAAFRGETDSEKDSEFLCFLRGDAQDIVTAGHKVCGSAQRRRRGAILQHGSLLLSASDVAPELVGITDLHSGVTLPEDFAQRLGDAIVRGLKGAG